jgi:uroporphyrinogen decarboxylase
VVQALQARGVPVIVFGTAMSTHFPLLRRTRADVLGCDWRIELDQVGTDRCASRRLARVQR